MHHNSVNANLYETRHAYINVRIHLPVRPGSLGRSGKVFVLEHFSGGVLGQSKQVNSS